MDVVASGITIGALAASIAKSVVKLKACWEAIQDASDDIHFLVKRVELLSLVLRDIQDDQTQNPVSSLLLDGSTVSTCLETCKAAADRLGQLADKMAKKYRVVSSTEEEMALLRLQPDIIQAKIMQALPSGTSPTPLALQPHQNDRLAPVSSSEATGTRVQGSGTQSYQSFWQLTGAFNVLGDLTVSRKSYEKKSTKESDSFQDLEAHEEVRAFYRGPAWLVNRAWALHAVKARNGWDCYFRQYNILPSSSPVFMYARSGNVTGLRELFDKNQASLWDCCDDGWSPLHLGADSNHRNNVGESPTELAIELLSPNRLGTHEEALDLSCLLTKKAEVDPSYLRFYHGSEEVFTLWQQSLSPQYYETALEERIELAIELSLDHYSNGPALFRRALTRGHIPRLAVGMRNGKGQTVLHAVALVLGEFAQYMLKHPLAQNKLYEEDLAGWRLILREVISEGADLHSTDSASHTPFTSLLSGISDSTSGDALYPRVDTLNAWLNDLRDCGVDLYEYGRREEGLYRDSSASGDIERNWAPFLRPGIWKLVSFTYGGSPSDWHL
ncbi:hypothetical protein JMJ35_006081 [Cladonia borealis]|uniref:Fungal N-terminal domain-containing protein n=1 Tax=Cladonia borealis TaxID=184061 RepID=A0AA39R1C0_9LECA|nr:hypothetical protein JMJ35_006081 [Cladonia borealis]